MVCYGISGVVNIAFPPPPPPPPLHVEGDRGAGDGISTMAGSGREIQKGKLLLFITAYFQSKKRTQERFLTSI